jgi:Flp pilus assembly protein protease CpaA
VVSELPVLLGGVLSLLASLWDLRTGRVPNVLLLVFLVPGLVLRLVGPLPATYGWTLLFGVVFSWLFWRGRVFGGGDAKLLMVLSLVVGDLWLVFSLWLSALLLGLAVLVWRGRVRLSPWPSLVGEAEEVRGTWLFGVGGVAYALVRLGFGIP